MDDEALPNGTAKVAPFTDPNTAYAQSLHHSSRALYADQFLRASHDVAPALHTTTTYHYPSNPEDLAPISDYNISYPPENHVYSRLSNPNLSRLEALLASLLGAPSLTFASGLSAAYAIYAHLRPARVFITGGYGGVHGVLAQLHRIAGGVHGESAYSKYSLSETSGAIGQGDVVHIETPLNPTGEAINLAQWVELAHANGAYVVVDATFAPPPLQDPFALGVDVVMHSGTKFIGGHSDLLLGVAAMKDSEWLRSMAVDRIFLGATPGNMEAWLAVRSLRTLDVRVRRQSESATKLVDKLWRDVNASVDGGSSETKRSEEEERSAALAKVFINVLHSSVQFRKGKVKGHADAQSDGDKDDNGAWLAKQMPANLHSPVFAVICATKDLARRLPSKLRLFSHATSLGGVESLIEWRLMSDGNVDHRLLRVSIGMEHVDDLYEDLGRAAVELLKEDGKLAAAQ